MKLTPEQLDMAAELTNLQRKFVLNMVSGQMSQRAAYYEAGGQAKTDAAADANSSRMLSDAKVRAFYDSLLESAASDAVMTRQEAMERLSTIARTKITDVARFKNVPAPEELTEEEGGPLHSSHIEMRDSSELDEDAAGAISEVTASKEGLKFKLHSPIQAIQELGKMQDWYAPEKHDHRSSDGSMSPRPLTDFYPDPPAEEDAEQ